MHEMFNLTKKQIHFRIQTNGARFRFVLGGSSFTRVIPGNIVHSRTGPRYKKTKLICTSRVFRLVLIFSICHAKPGTDVIFFFYPPDYRRKATKVLIHRASNYPNLLLGMPRYCYQLKIIYFFYYIFSLIDI